MKKKSANKTLTLPETPAVAAVWTFLTNHSHVLLCLYRNPQMRLRDVAIHVGITERMVQKIVAELQDDGFLKITKNGRCNHYQIITDLRLRHSLESQHTIGELLKLLT
jgi:predicted transcriptional regulator